MAKQWLVALVAAGGLMWAASPSQGQILDEWHEAWLDSIRATKHQPGPLSREGAILHSSIQDAINSINRVHKPMMYITPERPDASTGAAAAAAAHRVLSEHYPERQAIFDATLESQLSRVPNAGRRQRGVATGQEVADAILSARAQDGSHKPLAYEQKDGPGYWRPTEPGNPEPYNPEWGKVQPWAMESASQFGPPDPPAITSEQYAASLEQVRELGARDSTVRTQEQTDIGMFWANDRAGTFLPIGHLNHITQVVAEDQGLNMYEQARLFALTNIAMADAGITSWETKYDTDLWRPVTAIREADSDGNPLTQADPDWEPLYPVTPPFPAYTSGHATFAAAHAAVLAEYFGTDEITFTIMTDEPLYEGEAFRTYESFSEAAMENALSRIYIGVHYDFDGEWGNITGDAVGRHAFEVFAQPIPEPTTAVLGLLAVAAMGVTRRPTRRGQRA